MKKSKDQKKKAVEARAAGSGLEAGNKPPVVAAPERSPFDVPGIRTKVRTKDILEVIREGRARMR